MLLVPGMLLNTLGGFAAFIWLVFLGEWGVICYGAASLLVTTSILSFCLLPVMFFGGISTILMNKNKALGIVAGLPAVFYTPTLMTFWAISSFFLVLNSIKTDALFPGLLWAYGIAIGPWTFFASKEKDNVWTLLTILAYQLTCIILMLSLLFFKLSFWDAFCIVATIMGSVTIFKLIFSQSFGVDTQYNLQD